MNKQNFNSNKYRISGLYQKPFYKEHSFDMDELVNKFDDIYYNTELMFKEWQKDYDEENQEVMFEIIEERFWDGLSYWNVYFEPLVFDEQIAFECSLMPFEFNETKLLALAGCGMDLSPKLDAYQVLTHGTIDKDSSFFCINNKEYFEYVVGKGITDQMNRILNMQ